MQLMVVYDIAHDATRNRVADTCQDFGLDRIQYSVFCGALSGAHRKDLKHKLTRVLGKQPGDILIIHIADDEWNAHIQIHNDDPDRPAAPQLQASNWDD